MKYAIIKVVNGNFAVAVETNDEIVDQHLSILKSEEIYHATEAAE